MRLRRALDALQWGEGRHISDLEFVVVDRAVPGGQRTISGRDLKGRDVSYLISNDGTQVPFHRVLEVRLEGRTVWKKRTREPKQPGLLEVEGEAEAIGLADGKGEGSGEGSGEKKGKQADTEQGQ